MREQLLKQMKAGLVAWYPFDAGYKILYIGKENEPIAEFLREKNYTIEAISIGDIEKAGKFRYIIAIELFECNNNPSEVMVSLAKHLEKDGTLLIGANNRLGIRYFCGDWDPYTCRTFDGIENYYNVPDDLDYEVPGRLYAWSELNDIISKSGMNTKFYSVFPNLDYASHIISEKSKPNEDLANRILPLYHHYPTIFLEEERLYPTLIKNDLFHKMANAYLIECRWDEDYIDASYITLSSNRSKQRAMATIISSDKVVKKPLFPEGKVGIQTLINNMSDICSRGIKVVKFDLEADGIIMPFISGMMTQEVLQQKMKENVDDFYRIMDEFVEITKKSSDIVRNDDELGPIAKNGYVDMLPLNSFYVDDEFIFVDQEFSVPEYPIDAIIARAISTLYAYHEELNDCIPREEVYKRYNLLDRKDIFDRMEFEFLEDILNWKHLGMYWWHRRRHKNITDKNRAEMNFETEEYVNFSGDPLDDIGDKKVIIFGAGRFAMSFIDWYGPICDIECIADSDVNRQGQNIRGIPIVSPEEIADIDEEKYRVIICVKNYMPVVRQLIGLGIKNSRIYDAYKVYPRKINYIPAEKDDSLKQYKIGYISGVFDLFHKGHLNLLKRAKEKCEYLIVGVVSDEGVRKFKHVEPFIPFEERIEIVATCKYVDEAVEIPLEHRDARSAYALYHFDCQFCGSDYYKDPVFMADREWLISLGSNMEVLPYTDSTSSTKIKSLIEKGLV